MNLQESPEAVKPGLSFSGALSHAYIIWGGSEDSRCILADRLASAAVCAGSGQKPCEACAHCEKASRHIHPDIIVLDRNPDAKEIYVDQIRALREDAVVMPNEASKKVYIIRHAGSMNTSAQNAILKLLEEPPESASFILDAANPAALLPTVRSRCVELSADRLIAAAPARAGQDAAEFYQALKETPLRLCNYLFALEKLEKTAFADFIDGAKAYLAERMKDCFDGGETGLTPASMMKTVSVLDRAGVYLDSNVSLGHITGMMAAELIGVTAAAAPKP